MSSISAPFGLILKYILLVIVSLIAKLLNYPLALIVVLFVKKDGYLPNWLSWFQTPDNPLSGDNGWYYEHWQWRFKLPRWLCNYVGRVGWLWRNSMYGFAIDVLGIVGESNDTLVTVGNTKVSNRPMVPGMVKRYIVRGDKVIAFQWYYVKPWKNGKRCIRINLGWKLWSYNVFEPWKSQLVFSPNPAMGYSVE